MSDTTAPRMVTVTLTVTHADEQYGPNAWLVTSAVDGEADTYWTIETPYITGGPEVNRGLAAQLHLARTQREHRVSRLGRLSSEDEGIIQGELDDYSARAYRAELRLIAHNEFPDLCPRCGGDHDRIDRREPCPDGTIDMTRNRVATDDGQDIQWLG